MSDEATVRAGIERRLTALREAQAKAAQEAANLRARLDQVMVAAFRVEGGIAELETLLSGFDQVDEVDQGDQGGDTDGGAGE